MEKSGIEYQVWVLCGLSNFYILQPRVGQGMSSQSVAPRMDLHTAYVMEGDESTPLLSTGRRM